MALAIYKTFKSLWMNAYTHTPGEQRTETEAYFSATQRTNERRLGLFPCFFSSSSQILLVNNKPNTE